MAEATGQRLAAVSQWIDDHVRSQGRAADTLAWIRVAKIAEEAGEAVAALIALQGVNPRKGLAGPDVREVLVRELLDVATTALGAVEHLTGNEGRSMVLLDEHVAYVALRAGVEPVNSTRSNS